MQRVTQPRFRATTKMPIAVARAWGRHLATLCLLAGTGFGLGGAMGCAPRVAIEAPKEPIVINLNIKVEHEIRVSIDQDLDDLFEEEEELF